MRVIPVLDLRAGLAVRAIAGPRHAYLPLHGGLAPGPEPLARARAFRDHLGRTELYLADLDAIAGAPPALPLYREIRRLGLDLWVDAGVRDVENIRSLLEAGVTSVVCGLETLNGPSALARSLELAGPDRVVFSLDLRAGRPWIAPGADWGEREPRPLLDGAIALGIRRILLLDLDRVGTGAGVGPLDLVSWLVGGFPNVEVLLGGGVAGPSCLANLAKMGAAGVLVGSALHDGRIGPETLALYPG